MNEYQILYYTDYINKLLLQSKIIVRIAELLTEVIDNINNEKYNRNSHGLLIKQANNIIDNCVKQLKNINSKKEIDLPEIKKSKIQFFVNNLYLTSNVLKRVILHIENTKILNYDNIMCFMNCVADNKYMKILDNYEYNDAMNKHNNNLNHEYNTLLGININNLIKSLLNTPKYLQTLQLI